MTTVRDYQRTIDHEALRRAFEQPAKAVLLDGWAVECASGRGIDEAVRDPGQQFVGRSLRGYVHAADRGYVSTSPVAKVGKVRGRWLVRTASGSIYVLGESVWSGRRGADATTTIGAKP